MSTDKSEGIHAAAFGPIFSSNIEKIIPNTKSSEILIPLLTLCSFFDLNNYIWIKIDVIIVSPYIYFFSQIGSRKSF